MRSSSNSDFHPSKTDGNVQPWQPGEFDEQFQNTTTSEVKTNPIRHLNFDDISRDLKAGEAVPHGFQTINYPAADEKSKLPNPEEIKEDQLETREQTVTKWNFVDLDGTNGYIPQSEPVSRDGARLNQEDEEKESLIAEELNQAKTVLETAQAQAEEIINQAQNRAEQIVQQAEAERESTHQQAYQQGFSEGMEKARENLMAVNTVFNEAQTWRDQILSGSEKNIIEMIQGIAKKLFGGGYRLDPASIEEMVGRAITEAGRLGNLRVYMNPEDQAALMSLWQESELLVNGQKIQLVSSQDIQKGGCFIEGEFGSVDSRVEAQLALVQEKINTVLSNKEDEVIE